MPAASVDSPAPNTAPPNNTGRSQAKAVEGSATVGQLVDALAHWSLDDLDHHRLDLAVAIAELSGAAGRRWSCGPDEPTVALVRAASKLAITAPGATSAQAARLVGVLTDPPGR
ncbi:MAG: hypothetical protein ACK5RL_18835 [Acidimicrobiales bacterium]